MTHNIMYHSTHILWHYIATMFNESVCTSSLSKVDTCTRRTTIGDIILQFCQSITLRITTCKNNISNILSNLLIDIYLINHLTSLHNLFSRCNRCYLWHTALDILTYNQLLLIKSRIINNNLQHETVNLSLRQLISTLLLYWVLSSQYKERLRQIKGIITNGHLVFLHSLKQRTLHLSRSTVNLISQYKVSKHWTFLHMERLVLL